MARRLVVVHDGGEAQLIEVSANDELQLQDRVKRNPELLPVDELGLEEGLMVVGRETTLASGAVDLLALTRTGDLLVVEFKTGPQNPDFRGALAQLIDYGSDLWKMSVEQFETSVATRYFQGKHCPAGSPTKGLSSLAKAAAAQWPEHEQEDIDLLLGRLGDALAQGAFHYVVVAQRFTSPMEASVRYLNELAAPARFYLVELVRFTGSGFDAFEARTILKPSPQKSPSSGGTGASEQTFLTSITDDAYREVCAELFELARALGCKFEWGAKGTSIRLSIPERSQPLSIAWAFPPGVAGWMTMTDLTFGHDASQSLEPATEAALETYRSTLLALPGTEVMSKGGVAAVHVPPSAAVAHQTVIAEALASLVTAIVGSPTEDGAP